MKKLLILAAAAALLLASCAKVETTKVSENTGNIPVAFSNYVPRSITKATGSLVNAAVLNNDTHFGVYAWATAYAGNPLVATPLSANPGTPNFMSNVDVQYLSDTDTGSGNTYSPVRYWPTGDNPDYLSFTAYYPYNGAGITAPTFTTGVGSYAFTAKSKPEDMIDFMVADVVNDQLYGATNKYASTGTDSHKGTVQFTFKHQLTKVQFQFKTTTLPNTTVIELLDADLSGIKNSGTLSATYNASTHVTTTSWGSTATGAADYQITVDKVNPSSTAVKLSTTASTIDTKDIFLMVPQEMAAGVQELTLSWRVRVYNNETNATNNDGTTGLLSETTNSKTLSFYSDLKTSDTNDTAASAINWEKNHFVTYTITIGPKPIYFTAEVGTWEDVQDGYFNVQ